MNKTLFSYMLVTALIFSVSLSASEKAELDKPAPDFTLTDTNGKTHSLSDFKGKYVVLEWINFSCPFVKKHYNSGNMQKLQKVYTDKDVIWLSICSSGKGKQGYMESEEINKELEARKAAMTAYLIDASGKVGKMYGARTTPHMYIINPKGVLVYAGGIDDIASTDTDDIEKAKNYVSVNLDRLLEGKEVDTKVSKPYGCGVKYK
jgi:peroxiredoxin